MTDPPAVNAVDYIIIILFWRVATALVNCSDERGTLKRVPVGIDTTGHPGVSYGTRGSTWKPENTRSSGNLVGFPGII